MATHSSILAWRIPWREEPGRLRSTNQGKLEVVKREMARVNIDILGISELKWIGMGEFNSVDHYIYYFRQESLRRNEVGGPHPKSQAESDDRGLGDGGGACDPEWLGPCAGETRGGAVMRGR